MDTLSDETWDVVIAGTSLPQSLLALSLSRSGKKVLHVDPNIYYGGSDAGLDLTQVSTWVDDLQKGSNNTFFNPGLDASPGSSTTSTRAALGPTRSYTLSLNPQIIYAQSAFLPTLVSSQIHTQLEFLAVGSWWIYRAGEICKVPSTREDVFQDDAISRRDKTNLMKFLRFALQDEDSQEVDDQILLEQSLKAALDERFNVSEPLRSALLALALAPDSTSSTNFGFALGRIRRHMKSIGYFGPGFGAVFAKYGGNAEICQVACRSQAVGGGIYLLGHSIKDIGLEDSNISAEVSESVSVSKLLQLELSDGTILKARHVVGRVDDLPNLTTKTALPKDATLHSIDVVSNPLKRFFPPTSEGGPLPAVTIVLIDDGHIDDTCPIFLQIHSEDTGECPSGQCVLYGSVKSVDDTSETRLRKAIQSFISSVAGDGEIEILWSLTFTVMGSSPEHKIESDRVKSMSDQIHLFGPQVNSLSLDDDVLSDVKSVWEQIMAEEVADQTFLRFEAREQELDS